MSAAVLLAGVVVEGGLACPPADAGWLVPKAGEGTLGTSWFTDTTAVTAVSTGLATPPPHAHSSAAERTITATRTHPTATTLAVRRTLALSIMFSSPQRRLRP